MRTTTTRNVTLSAAAESIDLARQVAASRGETLNDAFRSWLKEYSATTPKLSIREFVEKYGTGNSVGEMPTREERNARD